MKLHEMSDEETFEDVLGPLGAKIPDTFKKIEESIKQFQDKYKQIGECEDSKKNCK